MTRSLLLKNIHTMAPMNGPETLIEGGSVVIEGNAITDVITDGRLPSADRVIDASNLLVMPGFVNTHHHLFQTLTRALPSGQDSPLYEWLAALRPVWGLMDDEDVACAVRVGIAELLLSGSTTTVDQRGSVAKPSLDVEFEIAGQMGIRYIGAWGGPDAGLLPTDHGPFLDECIAS